MFYTKYGQIAFFLSYLFPPEAATNIVKHLKRFNEFELSRDFYIKKCNLSKYIPYKYILTTCLHCRLSSCPPSSIYSSVYKNNHQKDLLKELKKTFSLNFDNSSRILNYLHNKRHIYDFDTGYYLMNMNHLIHRINQQFDNVLMINSYNYHQYSNILQYEVKASPHTKYVVKDDAYYYQTRYINYYNPLKVTNKQFKQSIQKNHYKKNKPKIASRRNY